MDVAKRIKLGMLKFVSLFAPEPTTFDGFSEALQEALTSPVCQAVELVLINVIGLGDLDALFAGGAALEQTLRYVHIQLLDKESGGSGTLAWASRYQKLETLDLTYCKIKGLSPCF